MSSRILIDPNNIVDLHPHPDHLTLSTQQTDSSTIGIPSIRDLIHWAYRKPYEKPRKYVLIKQAQYLTEEAQNALLKILEEPPQSTFITLAVNHPENLLPTILSRCQTYTVNDIEPPFSRNIQDKQGKSRLNSTPTDIPSIFKTAEALSKLPRQNVIAELDCLILSLRKENLTKNAKNIKNIMQMKEYLSANVNVRLAIENLFLKMIVENPKS